MMAASGEQQAACIMLIRASLSITTILNKTCYVWIGLIDILRSSQIESGVTTSEQQKCIGFNMTKDMNPQLPNHVTTGQRAAQLEAQSSDVEQGLEHISSPFRRKILDVPVQGKNKTRRTG
jgi:hypothetical protein